MPSDLHHSFTQPPHWEWVSGRCRLTKRVEQIARDYLTKNPGVPVEMATELDKRQAAKQATQQQDVISENADAVFRSPLSPWPVSDGDASVVGFFDYNCPFCRRALPNVVKLVNDDGKVRLARSCRS